MQAAITTAGLCRRFGRTHAVRDVDLEVPAGSIYAFLGPNGAGKTTTIRMLTGLLRPSSGRIAICGHAMPKDRLAIARLLGALVERPALYDHLSGRDNLDLTRRVLGLPASAVDEALGLADLRHAGGMRVGTYSLGMRQRLALACALLGNPRILILDEPGNGLDPEGISDLRDLLKRLARDEGMTIFVSSHQLAEAQLLASHVGVMAQGQLIAQGPLAEVLHRGAAQLLLRSDRPSDAAALLHSSRFRVRRDGDSVIVDVEKRDGDAALIVDQLVASGLRLFEVRQCDPTLEQLYHQLVRSGIDRPSLPRAA